MIEKYNNFLLLEYKSIGTLYHIVDFNKLFYILENNEIKSYHFNNISTTRDKMLNGYVGDTPTSVFKLELDGGKISNNYKIRPFVYTSRTNIKFYDEQEEQIATNRIKNAKKYINKVILIKSRVERLKNSRWFTSDGGNFKGKYITFPELLSKVVDKLKKHNIQLFVQHGSLIKKDDNYIKSLINYNIKKINHGYAYYARGNRKVFDKRFNLNTYKEIVKPIDDRNDEIEKLVIGRTYYNIWVYKNKQEDINIKLPDGFKLYEFDLQYENEDIIKENNNEILIKKGYLRDINPI